MKNYEKYADEIRNYKGNNLCCDFIKQHILKSDSCSDLSCAVCHMLQTIWLMEEYEEPETYWSKVKVDTPILVKELEYEEWDRRHFARYENGIVYAWNYGHTSWTAFDNDDVTAWKYSKLADEEGSKE